ncbi:excalibur calcium-binding domain-containing protein [Nocardioides acrostichi]|uniref:Excalibur calcium-binding domain-containing protein n=1 Tax=Nocardioides acrostichi TaxID=2784339 RepID=A0A930Y757_9ACTN|nr:excalibur calcium-binding domain-containing protein [Nocardioides acrostichi]MBF4161692.1 excalibur calcium-binding domain-containing protein [Nocardioides acrostichi]
MSYGQRPSRWRINLLTIVAVPLALVGGCAAGGVVGAGLAVEGQQQTSASPAVDTAAPTQDEIDAEVARLADEQSSAIVDDQVDAAVASVSRDFKQRLRTQRDKARAGLADLKKSLTSQHQADLKKAVAAARADERARAEAAAPAPASASAAPSTDPRFSYCYEANDAGYGPYRRGVDPEYDWYDDRDGDGIVCET